MKTLGVIGGLGPAASAYFMELITRLTPAKTDQEHLDIILFSRPNVPDRTAYILDNEKPSPAPSMIDTVKKLESLGVAYICAPCVTSHYIFDEIQRETGAQLVNMIAETVSVLKARGCKKAGIMATTGTVSSKLFQSALSSEGLEWALPDENSQALVMHAIYDEVKAGKKVDAESFMKAADNLFSQGCDCIILGCTELSVVNRDLALDERFVDAMEVLARKCIKLCMD